jgi:hypothetical protein
MKITQLRGDLAAFRNLDLSIVLNAMKTENSRKPVTTLRQDIPYLTPQTKSLAAEKIPVVLFGVTLKRDDEGIGVVSYTGLVLLSIGNLIDRVLNGEVVDYINLLFMQFAVFNFADICVCVGVGLWVLVIFLEELHAENGQSPKEQ